MQPGSRPFKRGDILHTTDTPVDALSILLQGRLEARLAAASSDSTQAPATITQTYRLFSIDRNVFLGASALATNSPCGCTYTASDDGSLLCYPVADPDQFWSLLQCQKDYGTFVIQSLGLLIGQTHGALGTLWERTERLRIQVGNLALFFWVLRQANDCSHTPSSPWFRDALEQYGLLREAGMQPSPLFNPDFIREDHDAPDPAEEALFRSPLPPDPIGYAMRVNAIPLETRKLFFGAEAHVMERHVREAADCLNDLFARGRLLLARYETLIRRMYADGEESLFHAYLKLAREMAVAGQNPSSAAAAIDLLIERLDETLQTQVNEYGRPPDIDLAYIRHARNQLTAFLNGTSDDGDGKPMHAAMHALPEELKDSTARLLAYARMPQAQTDAFMLALTAFRGLKDRFAQSPEAREIRNAMGEHFRILYREVFRRSLFEHDSSRLVGMFLQFGFADEWLLDPEQSLTLYRLAGKDALRAAAVGKAPAEQGATDQQPTVAGRQEFGSASGVHAVYTLREWLDPWPDTRLDTRSASRSASTRRPAMERAAYSTPSFTGR